MKFDLNKLAFICLHTSWWNLYPPQDIADILNKEIVYDNWLNYIKNDYNNHKKLWLYLHTPFCEWKCLFCSCWSNKVINSRSLETYLENLIKELKYFAPIFKWIKLNHAYFGWWTPSIFSEIQLEYLLKNIRELYEFTDHVQFNFEVSPMTINEEKIRILAKYWISRVTIGIQTMTEKSLVLNSRKQTWSKIEKIFNWIRKYGIRNINIDILPGIPWENLKDFLLNLKRLINLSPDMIHLYPFRPTDETLFTKEWNIYSDKDVKNRNLMYEMWVKLVEKNWYFWIDNDSWWKKDEAKNEQEVDKILNNCSIIGFWYPTRSYIHKNLMYFTWFEMYDENNDFKYVWIKLSKEDYIVRYIISHFRHWFKIDEINQKFSIDFEDLFKEEISFLKANWMIIIIDWRFETKINNVFEKLLFSKIFYNKKYINSYLEKYSYERDENYIKKFEDILSVSYK